jgi:hypothetical protein
LEWTDVSEVRQGDDEVRTSETTVYISQTTRRYIPEGRHLQMRTELRKDATLKANT